MRLPNNWKPRPYQLNLWKYLEAGGKEALVIAHRRWGKDDVALHWSACAMQERVGTYWHMLPEAAQARKAIWEAVNPHTALRRIDEAFPKEIRETTREDQMFIRFRNGSTWQVVGSDNYDSLVGSPPVGVVGSEWALAKPQARAYIRPILMENGGWQLYITTPRGKNHAYRMMQSLKADPKAYVEISDALVTGVFSRTDLEAEKKAYIAEYGRNIGESLFLQEYHCSFDAAIVGSIFGKDIAEVEKQGRIARIQHDPTRLVLTSWDLGEGDSTAVWFYQMDGLTARYIDYYECNREKTVHYLEMLRSKGYSYGTCYLPHDSEQNRMNASNTIAGQFRQNGFNVQVIPSTPKSTQIAAGSTRLSNAVFDAEKCEAGIEALKHYRWNYNKSLEETTSTPVHDWASHPADAFMCGSIPVERLEEVRPPRRTVYPSQW